MKRNKLKQEYYKETLCKWKNKEGVPTKEYTKWVEDKLIKQLELKVY